MLRDCFSTERVRPDSEHYPGFLRPRKHLIDCLIKVSDYSIKGFDSMQKLNDLNPVLFYFNKTVFEIRQQQSHLIKFTK